MEPVYVSINRRTDKESMGVSTFARMNCVDAKIVKKVAQIITEKCYASWTLPQVHV